MVRPLKIGCCLVLSTASFLPVSIYNLLNDWPAFLILNDFAGSSAGKESACNAGDPGLIPGLGRFTGDEIGYPLQYSWASLAAQMVKNLPAVWETWVWSLHWGDPLEDGMSTHSSIIAWRIPKDRGAWRAIVYGFAKSQAIKHNTWSYSLVSSCLGACSQPQLESTGLGLQRVKQTEQLTLTKT